jgi:predicted XRE-type DNA-binding protein
MKNQTFESVWDAIENTAAETKNMKLRAKLMMVLKAHLGKQRPTKLFGVTKPRISDLMRGKINLFGLYALVNMAAAGLQIELNVIAAV